MAVENYTSVRYNSAKKVATFAMVYQCMQMSVLTYARSKQTFE